MEYIIGWDTAVDEFSTAVILKVEGQQYTILERKHELSKGQLQRLILQWKTKTKRWHKRLTLQKEILTRETIMNKIVRTKEEIDRVLRWTDKAEEGGTHFRSMTFEQGVAAMYEWLTDTNAYAPDEE